MLQEPVLTFSSIQFSHSSCPTLCDPMTAAYQASLSFTISQSLLKLMSIESMMPSNRLILCRPLLLPPSIFPSIRVFSNESVLHIRWPKFQLQHQSFHIHSGLIEYSFRTDFLQDGLVGSPCCPQDSEESQDSLLQHHSSKASILQHSAFFIVQLLYPYMTTGKTIALTRQTFVSKVMSLLFNMLSWSFIFFQGPSIFSFHGCSHHLQ